MTLPCGTVTFLFSDIEGSTKLWENNPGDMQTALARHDALMRGAIEKNSGHVFKTIGDAFCAAFENASHALRAAIESQLAIETEDWPSLARIKVRMALHTGSAEVRDQDYFGPTLNRVARLLAAGHGGQVLLSAATEHLVEDILGDGVSVRDMGDKRLKDLVKPERVFQLVAPGLTHDFPPLKTLDALANNLPIQLTNFVGRESEIHEIQELLTSHRLVTLVGSGGSGKTRLSLQAAANLVDIFQDGVWFVELAPLVEGSLIPQAVATTLNIKEESGTAVTDTIVSKLREADMLLVLDNCEHLVQACASFCQTLLTSCAKVRILASSREALRVYGERAYRVPSLSTPDPARDLTAESLSNFETVQLFLDRALQVQPGFAVTDEVAPALSSICHQLDGIPLAIELAAARVRNMSVGEVESRLDLRFQLLKGGSRTALPRQQTLRSLIDWSFDLLNEKEKALLCRLSVFSGGWSLESAETVCSGDPVEEWEVLDLLCSLVDKSLVVGDPIGASYRYHLLQTVRQYARDMVQEKGETDVLRDRHLECFVALAEEAEPNLTGSEQNAWMDRLETERDNLRSALAWATERPRERELGLRLCGAARRLWSVRGPLSEGRAWFRTILEATADGPRTLARAHALNGAGALAWHQGDFESASGLFEAGLGIRRELGDRRGTAASLCSLGVVALEQGRYTVARDLYEESLSVMRELGDRLGIAVSLCNLGTVVYELGDAAAASTLFADGLVLQRELGDKSGIAFTLNNLGILERARGDFAAARRFCAEGLSIRRQLGDKTGTGYSLLNLAHAAYEMSDFVSARSHCHEGLSFIQETADRRGIAEVLEAFAGLAAAQADPLQAARLWGASESLREELGAPMSASNRRRAEQWMERGRESAGKRAFNGAWAEGRAMTTEQAVACAMGRQGD